ncbi:hypothetical protein BDF20DRAFT_874577 [Mycotypha africana]|uniref:uncharacterized protein n=1 Tax=Mycotypha africana TaxID=64632 RepID=UPI002301FB50|nr:uncharacterized protein BDF20DRAFT_874577 [Mycotypha africana]KAI8977397.1 hypothetical protein BDF20DRAFT_874577 [Mycotypha africana]
MLINYFKSCPPTEELFLYDLQQKAIVLLTIATMWCPRSAIGTLLFQDIHFIQPNSTASPPTRVTIMARNPKEFDLKVSRYGATGSLSIQDESVDYLTSCLFSNAGNQFCNHC